MEAFLLIPLADTFTPDEWQAIRLTLDVAVWAVLIDLPLAIGLAFALSRGRFPGRGALDTAVHLPLVLPPVVVGRLLLLLFGLHGPIGAWLHSWFGIRLVFTRAGAELACSVMILPLMLRAIRLSLEAVDPGLEQAARTLGAGAWDRFLSITLPLAAPGVLVAAITGFAAALGEFGAVITFAANHPRTNADPAPCDLQRAAKPGWGGGGGAAVAGVGGAGDRVPGAGGKPGPAVAGAGWPLSRYAVGDEPR